MGTLWEQGGKLLANDAGALIECDSCPCGAPCDGCENGLGAQRYLLEFEGIPAGCTPGNGGYVVQYASGVLACEFFYNDTWGYWELLIDESRIVVTGDHGPYFQLDGHDKKCLTWNRLEIPFVWGRLDCDDSADKCYLTALG